MAVSRILGRGVYAPAEVAHLVGLDAATINRWAFGYRNYAGIVDPDLPNIGARKAVSFLTLMELYLMARFKKGGMAPEKFRIAAGTVAARENIEHPFAFEHLEQFMRHDSNNFFWRTGEDWEQITGKNRGNIVWDGVVAPYLREVDFENAYARRWYPDGLDRLVVLDPAIQMGAPVVAGTRIPTANISSLIAGGDSDPFVAECYGIDVEQVKAAARFEARLKQAA